MTRYSDGVGMPPMSPPRPGRTGGDRDDDGPHEFDIGTIRERIVAHWNSLPEAHREAMRRRWRKMGNRNPRRFPFLREPQ